MFNLPPDDTAAAPVLTDRFGRSFPYLRLSITDVCNFKCSYCLPDGYKPTGPSPFLSRSELVRLAQAFIGMGTWKIRLTGGEPTVRRDFFDIAADIAALDGLRTLALTTNGYKLPQRAERMRAAGISAINISIDSLSRSGFKAVTGRDRLRDVMDGIEACIAAGFESIKLNSVLLRGVNEDELPELIAFVADKPVTMRFIELMETGLSGEFFRRHHLPATAVRALLDAGGWTTIPRVPGAGPAERFTHPESQGEVGLIAPYARNFCAGCNRLRVSARGDLHLCLFGTTGFPLRDLLRDDSQRPALQTRLTKLLALKAETHRLHAGDTGATPHLASIGG